MIWIHQLLVALLSVTLVLGLDDPYKILGVHRKATIPEIKKAYKKLVKEWHPDKNDDPGAPSRFMEVTESYELLTDPERRKLYDNFGRIEDARTRRDSSYRHLDPFDEILTGYRFKFTDDITLFHRLSITTRAYENVVVPKSFRSPHLLLFYSDWCFACLQIQPVWRRVMEELEPIGVAVATVHAENEKTLARKLRITSLPTLVLLIDGKANFYRESLYSVQKIVELVRGKLPYRLVTRVEDDRAGVEQFLSGWRDNKVRALVFQKTDPLRLRYLIAAFFHRERVAFGFVPPGASTAELRVRFQVPADQDTLFLFNEISDRPMASLSMATIPIHTLHDLISNNNFLLLPRLSSQSLLDALCPGGMPTTRRRLCVVLVTEDSSAHDLPRNMMRRLALDSHYSKDRVRYMYVFLERQPAFISALTSGAGSGVDPMLRILLMLRRDASHVRYEWLHGGELWTNYNSTKQLLDDAIHRVLHSSQALANEAVIGELLDEQTQGMVGRVVSVLFQTLELFQDSLHKEHLLPTLSLIGTMLFIAVAGYTMNYLMKLEEKRVRDDCSVHGDGRRKSRNGGGPPELKMHELRGETYNGLVRLLKPGCRTIVLLLDDQTKPVLLPKFHKAIWPYRKYKSLQFGFLNLDRKGCVGWYTEILSLSLPVPRELTINKKNCVGTVLSLNGLSKYFCMYHAKHPEGVSKAKTRMKRMVWNQVGVATPGAFMGFQDSTSESDLSDVEQGHRNNNADKCPEVMLVGDLLEGLPNWLDRLFEGTTHRYYLNYWPEFKL